MGYEIIEHNFNFSFPTNICFGVGSRTQLPKSLQKHGHSRPLVVTDKGLAGLPIIDDIMSLLSGSGLKPTLYKDIAGNPVESQVTNGVVSFKGGDCDAVVAIGGGAVLDVAKVIALMVHHPGEIFDYEDGKPDALPVDQHIPTIFALPTTAGTGSEVGRASVISDEKTHEKRIVFDPKLLPAQVYVDPELTEALPAAMTAATGMDALTHLIEAYLAKGFHPMCDGIALEGIRLVADHLEDCVKFANTPPSDRKAHLYARGMLMNAAYMGAVAFQKGLGVVHSCAHALSAVCDTHHGLANAVMLPTCMEFNIKAVPERFDRMATATGQISSGAEFIPWIRSLNEKVGIPSSLSEIGVEEKMLPEIAALALQDGCHQTNPCPVNAEDFTEILKKAF